MALHQYIGARYVPKFYENSLGTAEWEAGVIYEPLTIVTYNLNSYTSKKLVPAAIGDPSANPSYWVATGLFNAQVAALSNRMDAAEGDIDDLEMQVSWKTPEMYGAVGDGITDDAAAFQALFADLSPGETVVLLANKYLVNSPLTLTAHEVKFVGIGKSQQYNTIVTNLNTGNFITISTFCVGFDSIGIEGPSYDSSGDQVLVYFDADDAVNVGNIDATFINCLIGKTHIGIAARGRNVEVRSSLFSQCFICFQAEQCSGAYECRGHIIQGCRIHGCGLAFDNLITSAESRKNIFVDGNLIDASGAIFRGYDAGVVISNNYVDRTTFGYTFNVIELTHDPLTSHSEPAVIQDNVVNGAGGSGSGILINTDVYARIKGNTIANMRYDGIGIGGTAIVIADGNLVDNCAQIAGRYNFSIAATVTGALIYNICKTGSISGGAGMTQDGNITLA